MSWDTMKKAKEEGGLFIKLKDGGSIEGVFVGEPYCFYGKYQDPTEYPKWQQGLSFKFKINFIVKDEAGNLSAKIFQGSSRLRDQLLVVKEEYGLDSAFKIKRTGSTKDDTVYTILFKQKLDPSTIEKIKHIKLHELKKSIESHHEEFEVDDSFDPSEYKEAS